MKFSRRQFAAACGATALTMPLAFALPASAAIVSTEEALTELVFGKDDAPIEVLEYASLSCPACKRFHDEVFPKLKEEYIDTGKIKFVFRDFPTNTPGMAAAMIARCAGPQKHAGMVDIFFDTQGQWGRAENPLQAMTMVSRMAGLGPGDVDACVKNTELYDAIRAGADKAHKEMGVNATPTVIVAGEKLEHSSYEAVKEAIDAALAKAQ